MSRHHTNLSSDVVVTRGSDHAVGQFVQVTDRRWAAHPDDLQGEGYVLKWDDLFKYNTNLLGATDADLYNDTKLLELANEYAKTLE